MNYLIKSIKWTKNNGVETWWKPDSSGYTNFICNAGIYTEADKHKEENNRTKLIPITKRIINKGRKQVEKVIEDEEKEIKRYKELIENYEKRIIKHKEHFKDLDKMESLI